MTIRQATPVDLARIAVLFGQLGYPNHAGHGCAQLELSSNVARTRAHQFYERQGYREKRVRFVKTLVP